MKISDETWKQRCYMLWLAMDTDARSDFFRKHPDAYDWINTDKARQFFNAAAEEEKDDPLGEPRLHSRP